MCRLKKWTCQIEYLLCCHLLCRILSHHRWPSWLPLAVRLVHLLPKPQPALHQPSQQRAAFTPSNLLPSLQLHPKTWAFCQQKEISFSFLQVWVLQEPVPSCSLSSRKPAQQVQLLPTFSIRWCPRSRELRPFRWYPRVDRSRLSLGPTRLSSPHLLQCRLPLPLLHRRQYPSSHQRKNRGRTTPMLHPPLT